MTELLEKAISKLRKLPSERQDEAAEVLLSMIDQDVGAVRLSPEQVAEVERRLEAPAESASHAEVLAFFQKSAV
ncbi:MAG: hypothetical protein MI755_19500 [Sphingomonadales bacterium]|nr:hypothetical protein [Sphingomonadales bacterium]